MEEELDEHVFDKKLVDEVLAAVRKRAATSMRNFRQYCSNGHESLAQKELNAIDCTLRQARALGVLNGSLEFNTRSISIMEASKPHIALGLSRVPMELLRHELDRFGVPGREGPSDPPDLTPQGF